MVSKAVSFVICIACYYRFTGIVAFQCSYSIYFCYGALKCNRYFGLAIATGGLLIWRAAFKNYQLGEFLGLRAEQNIFHQKGILARVRHPIYLGLILVVLGFVIFDVRWPSVVSAACLFAYLPLGIFWEEKKLIAQFGNAYLEYQKRVPAIIPRLF
ncbi:MAG: methyltransferase family protein [Flammeovirgaceae bacterium]